MAETHSQQGDCIPYGSGLAFLVEHSCNEHRKCQHYIRSRYHGILINYKEAHRYHSFEKPAERRKEFYHYKECFKEYELHQFQCKRER